MAKIYKQQSYTYDGGKNSGSSSSTNKGLGFTRTATNHKTGKTTTTTGKTSPVTKAEYSSNGSMKKEAVSSVGKSFRKTAINRGSTATTPGVKTGISKVRKKLY